MTAPVDRRESPTSRAALAADVSVLGVLKDSRRRVHLGMASQKAAKRLDAAIAAVAELLGADREVDRARAALASPALSQLETAAASSRLRVAEIRRRTALAAMERLP